MLTLGNSNQIVLLWSDMSYVHMNEKHALELLSSYVLIVKVLWRRHTRWFRRLQALRMPAGGQQVTFKINFPFFYVFSKSSKSHDLLEALPTLVMRSTICSCLQRRG